MLDELGVQTASMPFNIFKINKESVEAILNKSLNQFKFDSTCFQLAFNIFFRLSTMSNDLFKCPRHLVQQSVECMLKQMLKLFNTSHVVYLTSWLFALWAP